MIRCVGGEYNHKKDKAERRDNKGWMAVCAKGDCLSYLVWFNKLKQTKGLIKYEIDDNSHYFLKKDSEHAFRIPLNLMQPRRTRDWLKAFLADDQELAERITDKGYLDKKKILTIKAITTILSCLSRSRKTSIPYSKILL